MVERKHYLRRKYILVVWSTGDSIVLLRFILYRQQYLQCQMKICYRFLHTAAYASSSNVSHRRFKPRCKRQSKIQCKITATIFSRCWKHCQSHLKTTGQTLAVQIVLLFLPLFFPFIKWCCLNTWSIARASILSSVSISCHHRKRKFCRFTRFCIMFLHACLILHLEMPLYLLSIALRRL